jgi:hypothetical protein
MNVRFLLSLALLSSTPLALAQAASETPKPTTSSSARKSGQVVHQDFKADHTATSTSATPTKTSPQAETKPRDAASGMPTGRRMAKPDTTPTTTKPEDAAKIKSHSNQTNN